MCSSVVPEAGGRKRLPPREVHNDFSHGGFVPATPTPKPFYEGRTEEAFCALPLVGPAFLGQWFRKAMSMEWVLVESSVLAAAAYADHERLLYLEFRSGAIYRYFDFPKQKYDELLAADSKGQYFSWQIRDRFLYEQVRPGYRTAS
jgi:KTSC domain